MKVSDAGTYAFGLLVGTEAREHLHPDRVGLEALGKREVMLVGQHRGGYQHRHLFAIDGGLEGRPQGHLGLAEADVAAEQAVHRAARLHVGLDLLDGAQLIGCLLVGEGHLQL